MKKRPADITLTGKEKKILEIEKWLLEWLAKN